MLYNIVSTPRSGSTLLMHSIYQYKELSGPAEFYNETIHWKNGKHNPDLVGHINTIISNAKDRTVVIKNHVNVLDRHYDMMLSGEEPEELVAATTNLLEIPQYTILSVREDIIEQAVSTAYSHTVGKWTYGPGDDTSIIAEVPEERINNAVDILVRYYNLMYQTYIYNANAVISYEELGTTPKQAYANLEFAESNLIDLDPITVKSPKKEIVITNINDTYDRALTRLQSADIYFPIVNNKLDMGEWKEKVL